MQGYSVGQYPGYGQFDLSVGARPINRLTDNRTIPITQYISPGSVTSSYQDYIYPDRIPANFGMTNPMLHAIPIPTPNQYPKR
jgi:hypothetical protein